MAEPLQHGPGAVAERYADGVCLLDTGFAGRPGTIGVYLVPAADDEPPQHRFDLVEAGPASCFEAVETAIREAGYEPGNVGRVLVTHVHLDHGSAAGHWATRHGAEIVVDARGAPHLSDPSRLMASARRVYGDALERAWGVMIPVQGDRLRPCEDGEALRVGGREVRVVHTPGHASHHCVYAYDDGTMYVGDAAGIRFTETDVIRPALPPPETDLEAAEASLERLRALRPRRLRLTHFGQVGDADAHLRAVPERNRAWAEAVLALARAGADVEAMEAGLDALARRELEAAGADDETIRRHLATSDAAMTVAGLVRYWKTRGRERWLEATGG